MVKKVSWFICLLILGVSCLDEPDCFRLNNNIVGIAFKKMIGGAADTVALVGVQASASDSVFNEFVLTNGIYLPLNFFDTQTTFAIQGIDDLHLLSLGYDVKSQFVSDECGARFVLSNLSLLAEDFDSIRIVNRTPYPSEAGANIEIYRCPITNLVKVSFRQLQMETSVVSARKILQVSDDYSGVNRYIDTTLSAIYLPLNPSANSNLFSIDLADQVPPLNVTLSYARHAKKFFDKCGDQQQYGSLAITTSSGFDSLLFVKDTIQDPPLTNIIVYKCPQTNLMRLYFKQAGTGTRSDTLHVSSITDDYSGTTYYPNADLIFATLPLNPNAGSTEFSFNIIEGTPTTKKLKVTYTATPTVLYNACGSQALFTNLAVESSGFTTVAPPKVTTVQYPVVTNIEIVQ